MEFIIPGKPKGKGRPRFTKQGFAYTDKNTKEYEKLVKISYLNTIGNKVYDQAIKIEIWAYFEPNKGISNKKKKELIGKVYNKMPDSDNIAKIILDGLGGVAYDNDNLVTDLVIHKRYAEENKVIVMIEEVNE